ncbi:Dna-J like membrane chaperone protein [Blastopirellula retiformator]|uniref:Dna-J like membrane chaperone protein n=2 Tax=Blastopirellula retiformator TaxID=2527970 RepID=A0A5C5VNC6_9BACT|nr:Dna-J like membrane chaperone protein [Blastopirellula retiformator]
MIAILLLLFGLVLIPAVDAWGRAGSGGSFSGGSSYSGGGFSGGGYSSYSGGRHGDGAALAALINFLFRHPTIGVPTVVIGALLFFWYMTKASEHQQRRYIHRAFDKLDDDHINACLAALQQSDPSFDMQKFKQRAENAFRKIQDAWCEQDLTPIHAFVSDGVYERFSLQIEEQHEHGYRNVVEDVRILSISPIEIVASRNDQNAFEVISLRVSARAKDYRVDRATGKMIPGSKNNESFTEVWTFLRRRGAKTQPDKAGLIEGSCPNCGQSIRINQWDKCGSCGSLLRSGEHDWVLSEITQSAVWKPSSGSTLNSATRYWISHDPGFNTHHLEDRASVIFTRKVTADRHGDMRPLIKVSHDMFSDTHRGTYEARERAFYTDCGVGSVDVIGVTTDEHFDRALIDVRWSGRRNQQKGESVNKSSNPSTLRTLMVLGRKHGVQTKVEKSVSSLQCPGCGAPESDAASNSCEFCHMVLNDGASDWVLFDWLPYSSNEARDLRKRANEGIETVVSSIPLDRRYDENDQPIAMQPSAVIVSQVVGNISGSDLDKAKINGRSLREFAKIDDVDLIAWVVQVAAADGKLDPKEQKLLKEVAKMHGVPLNRVQGMLTDAAKGQLESPDPDHHGSGVQWLTRMIDMALIDGHLDRREQKVIAATGKRIGLSDYDVARLLAKRKSELYRQAQAELKERKKELARQKIRNGYQAEG